MNEVEGFEEDEISLYELWEKLRDGWRWIVGGVVAGGIVAGLALVVISPSYEATGILQTGKVAGAIIEEPATVVERLRSPSLLIEIARDVGNEDWIEEVTAGAASKVLSAQVPKGNPSFVELRVRAKSDEAAREIATVAMAKLIRRQDELSSETLKKIRFDLDVANEKLKKADADLEMLVNALTTINMKDGLFSQVSLLTSLKLQKESEAFGLRQTVFAMELSLLPPATQPAKVLEAIFVPTKPISPKKGLLLALGLIGGLFAGVMWVFVSDAWRRAKNSRKSVN